MKSRLPQSDKTRVLREGVTRTVDMVSISSSLDPARPHSWDSAFQSINDHRSPYQARPRGYKDKPLCTEESSNQLPHYPTGIARHEGEYRQYV